MPSLIELRNLSVFGLDENQNQKQIIDKINLQIEQGDIIGIVGPSGAGKTTLLKAISLLNPGFIKGEYFFQDRQIIPIINGIKLEEVRKNLIFIHQQPVMFKGTARYNIEYAFNLRKMRDKKYLNELINSFKLEDIIDRNVSLLSGGEKQRISLLRAMVVKPKVLILDEPTQNLDPANITNIEINLDHYMKNEKGTVIIVTHNLFQARRITNKLLIVINGQAMEFGKTKELFESPKNEKTKDFLSGKVIF